MICAFSLGMFCIPVWHLWHCRGVLSSASACAMSTATAFLTSRSSSTLSSGTKKAVVKEFQCYLCLRAGDVKSCTGAASLCTASL